jgi:hypothetical protein
MKFKIQLVTEHETGQEIQELVCLERETAELASIGIALDEAKTLLVSLQKEVVSRQLADYLAVKNKCPECEKPFRHKGKHPAVFRTLFGNLEFSSPRWFQCSCQAHSTRTFSPLSELLTDNCSPERLYLETKWASLISFDLAANFFEDAFPIEAHIQATTVRNHLHRVAKRVEAELGEEQFSFIDTCKRDLASLPKPSAPITVGIDGGYVRKWDDKKTHFEVIVGKSILEDGTNKCCGLVQTYDDKPKRRLFEMLNSQGMQANQQITFFSDGGDTVRKLQLYLNPEAEHLLDWFHVTMRLTVLTQTAKGLPMTFNDEDGKLLELQEPTLQAIESIKWYLWHGNSYQALQHLENLEMELDVSADENATTRKLLRAVEEFHTYITNNENFITNYGERYRQGDRISSGFVESAVNYVIAKRFTKRQQMQWSPEGAHLLLQTRTCVLNGDLEQTFRKWHPKFRASNDENLKMTA